MSETPHSSGFEQVRLGDSDMVVSSVGFGTYHLRDKIGPSEAIDAMGAAFNAGITLYDTSDNYGTEELIGLAVVEGVLPREEIVIATKTGLATSFQDAQEFAARRKRVDVTSDRIEEQVEKSLRLLGEDVGIIDLYQLHSYDPTTPPEVPAHTMDRLIQAGKIRAYGVSNYPAEAIAGLLNACDEFGLAYPVSSQPIANLVHGYDPAAAAITHANGMTTLAHSPLHKGLLTSTMVLEVSGLVAGSKEADMDAEFVADAQLGLGYLAELHNMALRSGHTLTQLAIAWLAMHPNTVVLSSPTNPQRLEDAQQGAAWKPDQEILALVDEAQERLAGTNFSEDMARIVTSRKLYYR